MYLFNRENLTRIEAWKARNGMTILRISLGLVFFWFGFLKFFPGLSSAEMLAGRTIHKLSLGFISPQFSMPLLAVWECLIGLGLITAYRLRITLLLLYMQMIGTFLPLVFFYSETWTDNIFVPTLLGQYIIKNIVLISAAIVIGATCGGGALISNPIVAKKAKHQEKLASRFQRRFHIDPDLK
ncbi:MAG TPA: DoxX family membrane protein [Sphingobacteriaceae bacterium]|nr:DoxX family membrane protein [Sphingobacteriaceae bacterium]